jgi:pimeloyl-ACP methyl ester carboxylesterase
MAPASVRRRILDCTVALAAFRPKRGRVGLRSEVKSLLEETMPKIRAGNITMNYDQQGSGEPLVLIPYLAADYACYAFQVPDYAKRFTCISVDLRGTGESDKPEGAYSTEMFADDIAALMQAIGIQKAHIYGVSLGAATGIWLAAKYPDRVKSLSLHSAWPKSDAFLKTVVQGWQVMAKAMNNVPEMVIQGIFPWCFTPALYASKPQYIQALSDFVRGRPKQPLDAFIRESDAVIGHDAQTQLGKIRAPTQITFGRYDMVTSTRFADELKNGIKNSELHIFEDCSHAPLYENVPAFNEKTFAFLSRNAG